MNDLRPSPRINYWFFTGGSIGVTLLGLYCLEQAKYAASSERIRLFMVFTHRSGLYKQLLKHHPHIEVVFIDLKSIPRALVLLARVFFEKNIFLYPPAFGLPPKGIRFFSRLLVLGNMGSEVRYAAVKKYAFEKIWFTHIHQISLTANIFETVIELLPNPPSQPLFPTLLHSHDDKLADLLSRPYVVFHPFAANEARTFPDSLSVQLVRSIYSEHSDCIIIISGGPADKERALKIIETAALPIGVVRFVEEFMESSFQKHIQIIDNANIYIGVDTGITHVAAHLSVPVVVLANQSNPMWLPEYAKKAEILLNLERCSCTPDKGGNCRTTIDKNDYYRCMVDVPKELILTTINNKIR